ncbi:hypothetical protein CHS0354_015205 [Potamilus streckersoni]|uniref:Apple domain-containing protein n=1 Tax=Potamilus streckersoni TaxID=2493646 RepID=A0AAE0VTQ0_9BIVA|nr:hypothetical protein CHS0354_015205 [Potamilus streckersoni]
MFYAAVQNYQSTRFYVALLNYQNITFYVALLNDQSTLHRRCSYDGYNNTDIKATDFGTDFQTVANSNITLNESVHLLGDVDFCKSVCEQSKLNDGYECWAFTFSEIDRCYLYYYSKPIYIGDLIEMGNSNSTSLYLKRCSNDPSTMAPSK